MSPSQPHPLGMLVNESETAHRFDARRPCSGASFFRGAVGSVLGIAVLAACTAMPSHDPESSTAQCRWEAVREERLSLPSGAHAYIEPTSLTVAENGTLLLGSPTLVFPSMYPTGPEIERDVFVGAVIGSNGSITGVPSPVPGAELSGFSAVDNHDGTWSVAFVVLQPGTRFPESEIARDIGYGLFDGKAWLVVETEPAPDGVLLNPMRASNLGLRSRTLLWALATRAEGGNAGVAVLRRTVGGWHITVEDPSNVHGLATAHMPSLGDVVAVARPDTMSQLLRGDIVIESISRRDGVGHLKLDSGNGNIRSPVFDSFEDPRWIGWLSDLGVEQGTRTEARVAPLSLRGSDRPAITVDSSSMRLHALGPLDPGASYWLSDHVGQARSILLLRTVDFRSEVLFRMPTPYDGPYGAVAVSPSEILISGPVMGTQGGSPTVTTLLVRLGRTCEPESE